MRPLWIVLFCLSLLIASTVSVSCCYGRFACETSCRLQNCRSGYCTQEGCSGTCRCSFCEEGSIIYKKDKKKGRGRWPRNRNFEEVDDFEIVD
ncbi:hypothetical protein QR680_004849 [Steinernema hermaphroditum]|uniref:Uncharacterized protein n=1 Tax=Steinernema hermaphroditum TaxID=289476 RepID=A0AA39LUC9_9BILA|nr:hypothetical protein QR680_004849 [Steinernema hermaphroditum]